MLVDPALVAAVLGRVDGRQVRAPSRARQRRRRRGDEPVVAVDEVEVERSAERPPGRAHVRRSCPRPRRRTRRGRAASAARARGGRARRRGPPRGAALSRAAGEDVHLDALAHEPLGQLAHVAREAALDDRRVLPGEDQDRGPTSRTLRPALRLRRQPVRAAGGAAIRSARSGRWGGSGPASAEEPRRGARRRAGGPGAGRAGRASRRAARRRRGSRPSPSAVAARRARR